MIDFNDMCKYDNSLKRSFPGCTASQLTHFVKPDKPGIAIIHVGTGNLTKKNQTEVEIFNEIIHAVIVLLLRYMYLHLSVDLYIKKK